MIEIKNTADCIVISIIAESVNARARPEHKRCYQCRKVNEPEESWTNQLRLATPAPGYKMATSSQALFSDAFLWMKSFFILIKISPRFVPKGAIKNKSVSVQIMAWRRTVHKPLSEPPCSLTHICGTRARWVNILRPVSNGHYFAPMLFIFGCESLSIEAVFYQYHVFGANAFISVAEMHLIYVYVNLQTITKRKVSARWW